MKSKHHQIELQPFQQWLLEEEVEFASSTRERKRLLCSLNGGIKVTVAGKVVWQGVQPFAAIEAYNSITEKYIDETINFKL